MWQLGEKRYEGIRGFRSLSSERSSTFAEHKLIGTKPRQQRTGEELETMQIEIYLHASFCVPEDEIDELEESRNVGYILPLLAGDGRYYGTFLITRIGQTIEKQGPDGGIWAATLSLSLKEYFYDDRAASARRQARYSAFAVPGNARPFLNPPTPTVSKNTALTASVGQIIAHATGIALGIVAATRDANKRGFYLRQMARQALALAASATATAGTTTSADGAQDVVAALQNGNTTGTLAAAAQRLYAAASAGNLANARVAAGDVQTLTALLSTAARKSAVLAATGKSLTGQ